MTLLRVLVALVAQSPPSAILINSLYPSSHHDHRGVLWLAGHVAWDQDWYRYLLFEFQQHFGVWRRGGLRWSAYIHSRLVRGQECGCCTRRRRSREISRDFPEARQEAADAGDEPAESREQVHMRRRNAMLRRVLKGSELLPPQPNTS